MTELSNAVIDAIVCAETGFAPDEATQAMTHEELRRIVKACIVKRVRLLAGFDAGAEAERRLAAPEAAEPVAPIGEVVVGPKGDVEGWTVVKWGESGCPPVGTKLYAGRAPTDSQAGPVAKSLWWCSNCAAPTAHSMRGCDLCCNGCHFITATRHDDPDDAGQAGRDAVEAAKLEKAFQEFMDEPVDWFVDGAPIKRRTTMDALTIASVEFGWNACSKALASHSPAPTAGRASE